MALDPAPILERQRKFAFDLETTTGTRKALTASNAITPCFDPEIDSDFETVDRPVNENLSRKASRIGSRAAKITTMTELYGSGSSGTRPYWVRLLRACGFDDTGTAGIFKPITGATKTMTFGRYRPGRTLYAIGCMGSFKITLMAGRPGIITWNFDGVWDQPTADTISTITYDSVIPPHVGAIDFALGTGDRLTIPQIEIDVQNVIVPRRDIEAVDSEGEATGIRAYYITGRNITWTVNPEALAISARDWFATNRNYDELSTTVTVGSGDNMCTLSSSKLQLVNPPKEEKDQGLVRDNLVFAANGDAGDDELVIDFVT